VRLCLGQHCGRDRDYMFVFHFYSFLLLILLLSAQRYCFFPTYEYCFFGNRIFGLLLRQKVSESTDKTTGMMTAKSIRKIKSTFDDSDLL
jgi:hypothetical protein